MHRIRWVRQSSAQEPTPRKGRVASLARTLRETFRAESTQPLTELRPVADPPLAPRDEAIFLLHTAAEVEHALMVQYLYACYSLGGPQVPADKKALVEQWQTTLLAIAREEMAHLLTVLNVLRLLGGSLNLEREDYPFRSDFYPFHFQLEPLSKNALAKYVLAEMPAGLQGAELDEIRGRANEANLDQELNRVGALYRQIIEILSRLDEEDINTEALSLAAAPEEWTHGLPGLLVQRPENLGEAQEALRAIAEQGEGPTEQGAAAGVTSHFNRFLDIYRQFPEGGWSAVRRVPRDPSTSAEPLPTRDEEAGRITAPRTRAWAQLANLHYRRLLMALAHSLRLAPQQEGGAASPRQVVTQWAFQGMHNLARLAQLLVTLPLNSAEESPVAALPFELPYSLTLPDLEADRWRLHRDLLQSSEELLVQLASGASEEEQALLASLREQDGAAATWLGGQLGPRPITGIQALYILPPLVIARFGSSPSPMDNYETEIRDVTGFRELVPAPTLQVDPEQGSIIAETTPPTVRFRDGEGRIRPIAPFLEVWAHFEKEEGLVPLTLEHLRQLGLTPSSLQWRVTAANLKAFRRTGAEGDRVVADTGPFNDHAARPLPGTAPNFKPGKSIPFGTVQFIRPTEAFPEIRLRFVPAAGNVYGPNASDPLVVDDVYDSTRGGWDDHWDGDPNAPLVTFPAGTYQGKNHPQTQRYISDGYFDDTCDGIVEVALEVGGRTLRSAARFCSGVPDFAPDSLHVRTLADDLEQAALGPESSGSASPEEVADVVRRALETVRLMNTAAMNADQGIGGTATNATNQAQHEATEYGRAFEPVYGQGAAPYFSVLRRHEALAESWSTGRLPIPEDLLRSYDEAADFSDAARRKMPALMRGSDTLELTLTRRQIAKLRRAAADTQTPKPPEEAMVELIRFFQGMAPLHTHIPTGEDTFVSQLFADPPTLLAYLRRASAKGPLAGAELNRPLVVPGDPEASAFVRLLRRVDHPMHGPFSRVVPGTAKTGLQLVIDWIASLA